MQPQASNLRVTATRPFRMPERDDSQAIVGNRVVKPGESLIVDRYLAGELISSGKAIASGAEAMPAAIRSNRKE